MRQHPHIQTLLAALVRKSSTIEWVAGVSRWHLSEQGAAAVLLKMDEFQGRIGTQGALTRKGPQSESAVLPALHVPVAQAAPLAKPRPEDKHLLNQHGKALREALLRSATGNEECPQLAEQVDGGEEPITLTRLTKTKLLASATCWMGAYNWGSGFWVINDKPPFQPVLVTTSASGFSDGTISTSMKGRGLGDCWSSEEWTWDGRQFVHTKFSSTGMCRLLAPGGAWSLPQIVTQVRQPSR